MPTAAESASQSIARGLRFLREILRLIENDQRVRAQVE